jgi:hypothetical protein
MKRSILVLGLFLIPFLSFMDVSDVRCQIPFNDPDELGTSHPIAGDTNNYWCFDCHYFESLPVNAKWVKPEIKLLPFHSSYYPVFSVGVHYPLPGGALVTPDCGQPGGICGPCQSCHTQTYMNDEFGDPDPTKPVWQNNGAGMDHGGANFGTDCLACHPHWPNYAELDPSQRYMFYPSGGGTGPSHDIHVRDPIRGPMIGCDDCHQDPYPALKDGACDECHSPEGAFDGVNDPIIGAFANWVSGDNPSKIYNTPTSLNPGKEDWCLGCHDDGDGFEDRSVIKTAYAPPVAGDNNRYGFKVSGHGRPDIDLGCEACHNLGITHIDGQQRTYSATSSPNNYQTGYRLRAKMTVPRQYIQLPPGVTPETSEEFQNQYLLCTYACHDYDKLTVGKSSGFRSARRTDYCGQVNNLHKTHIGRNDSLITSDTDWDGIADSPETCIVCHNVHGSGMRQEGNPNNILPNPVMIRDGVLISNPPFFQDKVPSLDFKFFKGTACNEPKGVQTASFDESRWAKLENLDDLSQNHVCQQCHFSDHGLYYREPSLIINRVWTADPATNQDQNSFAQGEDVRYKVEFTVVARPPANPYIITHPAYSKASNAYGSPNWSTSIQGYGYLSSGTYVWAADSPSPMAWDKTIPLTAPTGSNAGQVKIPLGMFGDDTLSGSVIVYDMGPTHTFDVTP